QPGTGLSAQSQCAGIRRTAVSPVRGERGHVAQRVPFRARAATLARSFWSRTTLRRRTVWGVTSTHSSSRQNSRLCSSDSRRGGTSLSQLSEVEEPVLV